MGVGWVGLGWVGLGWVGVGWVGVGWGGGVAQHCCHTLFACSECINFVAEPHKACHHMLYLTWQLQCRDMHPQTAQPIRLPDTCLQLT